MNVTIQGFFTSSSPGVREPNRVYVCVLGFGERSGWSTQETNVVHQNNIFSKFSQKHKLFPGSSYANMLLHRII
jgi:hypothetical protein